MRGPLSCVPQQLGHTVGHHSCCTQNTYLRCLMQGLQFWAPKMRVVSCSGFWPSFFAPLTWHAQQWGGTSCGGRICVPNTAPFLGAPLGAVRRGVCAIVPAAPCPPRLSFLIAIVSVYGHMFHFPAYAGRGWLEVLCLLCLARARPFLPTHAFHESRCRCDVDCACSFCEDLHGCRVFT